MKSITCLIIGAAEHDRAYERQMRLQARRGKQADTWARFLTLNYVEYENDALMSYQLASIAYLASRGPVHKDAGLFRYADASTLSAWRTPLLGGIFVYQYLKSRGLDVDLMKASGCMGVYLGLEAVDSDILKRMNKHATRDEFLRGIDLLASRDIATYASFIVGFPGDTPGTAMKIKEFVENSGIDYYNLKPFWYDHATPVSQHAEEFGLTGQGYNWKHATMDSSQAYDIIEDLIVETKGRYVGLHSGELWEIGQLDARGLSRSQINAVYDAHNSMLRRDLRRCGTREEKRESFSKLVSELQDLSLNPVAW